MVGVLLCALLGAVTAESTLYASVAGEITSSARLMVWINFNTPG